MGAGSLWSLAGRALAGTGTKRKLIVVLAEGGWDVSFCMDPKQGVPDVEGPEVDEVAADPDDRNEVRTFGDISVMTNASRRPAVGAFFEGWARHTAVINGVWMGSIAHTPCRRRVLTGQAAEGYPDIGVVAGHALSDREPLGSVDLAGVSYAGGLAYTTGRVGLMSQLKSLLTPEHALRPVEAGAATYPQRVSSEAERALIDAYLQGGVDSVRGMHGAGPQLDGYVESMDRAKRFRDSAQSIAARLQLGSAPGFLLQGELALDLLESETCRSVLLDSGSMWDTHTNSTLQHGHFERLFDGLDALMRDLRGRGMLDDTTVAVVSEMARTPRRNAAGGKDHWPHTSALLLGGGVAGGRVYGGTDDRMEALPVELATGELHTAGSLLKYDNLAAGILDMVGVDPQPWLPDVAPFRGATRT
jgi:hypothetical protein